MNKVSYIELHTKNVDQAKGFYGELFGWKFQSLPMTPRYEAMEGEQKGGIMEETSGSGYWLQYIDVEDVTASAKRAEQLGGRILKPKCEVPDMGWFAIVQDPVGCSFALWQNKK